MKLFKNNIAGVGLGLTRKCNLGCVHCSAGDAQNLNMQKDVMRAVFSQAHIKTLFCLGGELMLAPEVLSDVNDVLEECDNQPDSAVIITNGTMKGDKQYWEQLRRLRDNCLGIEKQPVQMYVSYDKFHQEAARKLMSAEEYRQNVMELAGNEFFHDFNVAANGMLWKSGRARNYVGDVEVVEPPYDMPWTGYFKYHDALFATSLAVSTLGDVFDNFDWRDYDAQKSSSFGNVLDKSIYEIITTSPGAIKCETVGDIERMRLRHSAFKTYLRAKAQNTMLGGDPDLTKMNFV